MAAAASPGSGSSTSSDWIVLRDGCLRCDEEGLRSLSYHPALNAILAVTSRGSIKVIDGTSGAILQASALHGKPRCPLPGPHTNTLNFDKPASDCQHDTERAGTRPANVSCSWLFSPGLRGFFATFGVSCCALADPQCLDMNVCVLQV